MSKLLKEPMIEYVFSHATIFLHQSTSNTHFFLFQEKKCMHCMQIMCYFIPLFPKARTISSTIQYVMVSAYEMQLQTCMSLYGDMYAYTCDVVHCLFPRSWHAHAVFYSHASVYRYEPMVCIIFIIWTQ